MKRIIEDAHGRVVFLDCPRCQGDGAVELRYQDERIGVEHMMGWQTFLEEELVHCGCDLTDDELDEIEKTAY